MSLINHRNKEVEGRVVIQCGKHKRSFHRPTKNHLGFIKMFCNGHNTFSDKQIMFSSKRDMFRTLMFHGTTDNLRNGMSYFKTRNELVEHPTDKGFFKEVKVLSDRGRKKLERLRKKYKNKACKD